MDGPTLTLRESELLIRAIEYFRKAEETEIAELSLPSGNKDYIPSCRERLGVYESLLEKLKALNVHE